MLFSLCGCSFLDSASESIIEFRTSWLTNLRSSVSDISDNWYINLKGGVEDKVSYTLEDLKRETSNLVSLDYESKKVAYEDDFIDALSDDNYEYITIQLGFEITQDITIPAGKTVLVDDKVILTVLKEVNLTIETGGCMIFDGISYLVLNELGTCTIEDGGALSTSETSSIIMSLEDALICGEEAVLSVNGMMQKGSVFEVYSDTALDLAIRSASDGAVINIVQDLGSTSAYRIYDVNKAISIVGTQTVNEDGTITATSIYGGFVLTEAGGVISGLEIYPAPQGVAAKVAITLDSGYTQSAAITVAASSATITNNIFYSTGAVDNGIEIFPYDGEDDSQSYTISDNTFVGFGGLNDESLAPILVREYSTDVTKFGKEIGCNALSISETQQTAIASGNSFEDCEIRMAVIDCSEGEEVVSVFVAGQDITGNHIFSGNYYITGDWNVTGAKLTVESGAVVTIGSGVTFYMDEASSMTIQDGASVVLQSKSVFETYGNVTGSVTGSGSFIDWPNYIEFTIMVATLDGIWEEDVVLGQYVGYDAGSLNTIYRATKLYGGAEYFAGYTTNFMLEADGEVLDDDYVFTKDTTLYVQFTGVSIPIYYNDNGGSGSGDNRSDITYPANIYLDNATTRKSDEYFAGWKIVGGTYSGDYITVITDEFMLDLLNAGYTSLNLEAQWISKNNLTGYSYVYYMNGGYQIDAYCNVYVYTPSGSESSSYDVDDYSYADGELALTGVADSSVYNEQAYVFFDVQEGYEISSVMVIENPTFINGVVSTGTYYDMTNQAIVSQNDNLPLVIESSKSLYVEVKTKRVSGDILEIQTVGLNPTDSLTIITDLQGFTFDVDDTIKFFARTATNSIVNEFYVVAYWTDDDGDTDVVTYYSPTGIIVEDDYAGGYVKFKIYSVDGRSVLAEDFEFDYVFKINEEE